jgi:two-component system chemotaxis sensor kinase CheA
MTNLLLALLVLGLLVGVLALRTTQASSTGSPARSSEWLCPELLDAASDAIVSVDDRGIVRSANRAAIEMFGASRISGQHLSSLIPQLRCSHLDSEPRTWQARRQDDGGSFPVRVALSRIEIEGRVAFAGILRDVSAEEEWERRLTEQAAELQRRNRQLQNAKRRAEEQAIEMEEQARFKSEFLANMSHELRTPLNSLLILAEVLAENRSGRLTATEIGYAKTISSSGQDLLRRIDDILDLAKVESGNLELDAQPTPIEAITDRIERMFAPVAHKAGLDLAIDVDPALPETLCLDPTRLAQILDNLLANAFKFTEAGGVRVALTSGGDRMQIAVRDTGIGIPSDRREAVFEAFKQVDAGTTRRFGGTGLGLAISRELAEHMDGTLTVDSEVGAGSTFTLDLPLRAATPRDADALVRVPRFGNTPMAPQLYAIDDEDSLLSGKRLLVIDPDIRTVFALSCALEAQGVRVVASDGLDDALETLAHASFDAVVLEVAVVEHAPEGALAALRSGSAARPVLVTVAPDQSARGRAWLEAGADALLPRPVDLIALLETLTDALVPAPAMGA